MGRWRFVSADEAHHWFWPLAGKFSATAFGILVRPRLDGQAGWCMGEWRNNKLHAGYGAEEWRDKWGRLPLRGTALNDSLFGSPLAVFGSATWRWMGEVADGQPHGRGSIFSVGLDVAGRVKCVGRWHHGALVEGTATTRTGHTYRGQFLDGLFHGRGRLELRTGLVYDGDWISGHPFGHGVLDATHIADLGDLPHCATAPQTSRWSLAGRYEGEWCNGMRHGTGVHLWPDGRTYTGAWFMNLPHGHGAHVGADGLAWEGEWSAGMRCGRGSSKTAAGATVSQGWWLADRRVSRHVYRHHQRTGKLRCRASCWVRNVGHTLATTAGNTWWRAKRGLPIIKT
jgi:hypothetical protein